MACGCRLLFVYILLAIVSTTLTETHPPKLIIVSMDGFRYDYLERLRPSDINHFKYFIDNGVKVEYVRNVYPSITYVCHYSMLTGLYPESHGIVQNNFYDPVLRDHFVLSNKSDNFDPKWFDVGAEPIYVSNNKAGPERRTGSVLFPTSFAKVKNIGPDYIVHKFEDIFNLTLLNTTERIDKMMHWFTRKVNPINLGLLYYPEPDVTGHDYGPDSAEVNDVIRGELNDALGYLKKSLEAAHMLDSTNIIITSDHGMTDMTKYINMDDYVNRSWYDEASEWRSDEMVSLIPKPGYEDKIIEKLRKVEDIHVWKKGCPELKHLHYTNNVRIQEIVVAAKEGGCILNNDKLPSYPKYPFVHPYGMHGYHPSIRKMSPFFIAHGPAFKRGYVSKPINIVDIYPLMCHLLEVPAAPNNGSLDNVKQMLLHGGGLNGYTVNAVTSDLSTSLNVLFLAWGLTVIY